MHTWMYPGGAESLLTSSSALLERFNSEVSLSLQLESVPSYTMPPPEEDIAELNKKQLAAFLAEHWCAHQPSQDSSPLGSALF